MKAFSYMIPAFFLALPVYAQLPQNLSPGAGSQRLNEEIAEQRREQNISEFQADSKIDKAVDVPGQVPHTLSKENEVRDIYIRRISFSPSEILPPALFEDIKAQNEGRKISVNDIFRMVNDINNAYLLHGAAGAKAYLSAQDISGGDLYISLVEGRVRNVNVSGNENTSAGYIRDYFDIEPYSIVDLNRLQQKVLEFNAGNDAKTRLSLAPGPCYGTSDLDIVVKEPQRFSISLFCDNSGQDETGLIREGAYLSARSLLGRRDNLFLGGVMSEGTYNAFGSYEIPETLFNTRIGIGFDYSKTEIVNGYLDFLDITGDYHDFYFYIKKPVLIHERSTSNIVLTFMTKEGSNYIHDIRTQNNKTDEITLAFDNITLFSGGYMFHSVGVTGGVNDSSKKKEFYRFNYTGEYQQNLIWNFSVNFKLRGQFGEFRDGRVLPSSEQFQIGGVNTVRGYREGMLIANSGISESVELQYDFAPMIEKPDMVSSLKLFTFFDCGTIYPNSAAALPGDYEKTIYSTGAGLRATLFTFMEAQLVYAKALRKHHYFEDTGESFLFFVKVTY